MVMDVGDSPQSDKFHECAEESSKEWIIQAYLIEDQRIRADNVPDWILVLTFWESKQNQADYHRSLHHSQETINRSKLKVCFKV